MKSLDGQRWENTYKPLRKKPTTQGEGKGKGQDRYPNSHTPYEGSRMSGDFGRGIQVTGVTPYIHLKEGDAREPVKVPVLSVVTG